MHLQGQQPQTTSAEEGALTCPLLRNKFQHSEAENFYYASLCHICKEHNENLKRCSKCKTVAYCSKEHQAQDWTQHKEVCKAIAFTNEHVEFTGESNLKNWKQYRNRLRIAWCRLMNRELTPWEHNLWMFPRACAVCFSPNVLRDCPGCLNVAYCSEEHRNEHRESHERFCRNLKLCLDVDKCLLLERAYPRLEWIHNTFDEKAWPLNINILMKEMLDCRNDSYKQFVLKTEMVSPAATITNVLKSVPHLGQNLIVHVVGASSMEQFLEWQFISEFVFHWMSCLKSIRWILIGPEIINDLAFTKREKLCQACENHGNMYSIEMHCSMYHDVVHKIPNPDLLVIFNSGLHEFEGEERDTWKDSIPLLLKSKNTPLVITAYAESEIKRDVQRLQEYFQKVQFILEPQMNLFAGLKPFRNWDDESNWLSVYFVNGYVAALQNVS